MSGTSSYNLLFSPMIVTRLTDQNRQMAFQISINHKNVNSKYFSSKGIGKKKHILNSNICIFVTERCFIVAKWEKRVVPDTNFDERRRILKDPAFVRKLKLFTFVSKEISHNFT